MPSEADLVLEDEENGRQIANGGIFLFFGNGGREKKRDSGDGSKKS